MICSHLWLKNEAALHHSAAFVFAGRSDQWPRQAIDFPQCGLAGGVRSMWSRGAIGRQELPGEGGKGCKYAPTALAHNALTR
jgi:hypothetical protein